MTYKPDPSKLLAPQIKGPLIRKRLLRRMNGGAGRKMTIIQGRAAQGKTTLAASYVTRSKIPFVWLNLGPEDSDPAGLFHLLVHGLGPYLPEEALPHLMAYPSLSFGPREAMPLYREWSNAIFDRVVGPLRIVFDGADQMPSDALSWQLLQAMVEALPQSVHLLMLSRQPPPIDYDHLAQSPQARILGDSDLAFSILETKTFLRRHCGFELSEEVLRKVQQITEGWIGGVILFSQTLKVKFGESHPPMMDAIPLASFQTAVNRYLDDGRAGGNSPGDGDWCNRCNRGRPCRFLPRLSGREDGPVRRQMLFFGFQERGAAPVCANQSGQGGIFERLL
jgi:ATP/maltotriose-dependent transcriptional regulator MalT